MNMLPLSSGATIHCSPLALRSAFNSAAPGAKIIYAIGNVGRDKSVAGGGAMLHAVSYMALQLVETGKAYGFQRKLSAEHYEYFILKRRSDRSNVH